MTGNRPAELLLDDLLLVLELENELELDDECDELDEDEMLLEVLLETLDELLLSLWELVELLLLDRLDVELELTLLVLELDEKLEVESSS